MAYNGSGTFNLASGNPVVTGTTISSTWANSTLSDIATGLSNVICKDGQSTPTANLPMGNYKFTGLAAGTSNGDSVRYEQVTSAVAITGGTINGTTIGATTASTGAFTTLSASSTVTLSGGTANGVVYLDGSKAVTSGSALTFDGTTLNQLVSSASTALNISDGVASDFRITPGISSGVCRVGPQFGALAFYQSGSEGMRLTSTGLGIGTSSPGVKLDVVGPSNGDQIRFGNGRLYTFKTSAANTYDNSLLTLDSNSGVANYAWAISGSEKMRLDSAGNLGLGVTPSAWPGQSASYYVAQIGKTALYDAGGSSGRMSFNAYISSAGTNTYIANGYATRYDQNSGQHLWLTAPSGTAGNAITFTQAMTLTAAGDLGIGPGTTPGERLHIYSPSGDPAFRIQSSAGNCYVVNRASSSTMEFLNVMNGPMTFYTNSAERARIDSSGNLLVNSTSALTAAPAIQSIGSSTNRGYFTVGRATAATSGVAGSVVAFNGSNQITSIDFASNGANNNGFIQTYTWSAGSVVQGPYVNTGGTSWTTASDENLKDIIEPITNGLTKVASLRSVIGKFKTDSEGTRRAFLIAQDVQKVLPEAVGKDRDGNLGLNYTDVIPLLVSAIQELKAELDTIKSQIGAK